MNQIEKKIFCIATLIGLSAVVLGAFAAHGLQYNLNEASIKSFLTGVRYQFYHAFFLFIVGLTPSIKRYQKRIILWLVCVGVVLFSISIYLLSISKLTDYDLTFLGPITPIGGVVLISAWITFLYYIVKSKI